MSEFVRAFLAIDIDEEAVRRNLVEMQILASKMGADLKLVESENIHMTIRFLGDVTLNMVDKVYEEMKEVQFKPFSVKICGLGVFPNLSNPRILWAGITEGADQLKSVFTQLEPRLQALGFTPDPKGFSPHLTIARVRSARNKANLADLVMKNVKFDFGTVAAQCLRLKRSELKPPGPVYSTLKEFCPGP